MFTLRCFASALAILVMPCVVAQGGSRPPGEPWQHKRNPRRIRLIKIEDLRLAAYPFALKKASSPDGKFRARISGDNDSSKSLKVHRLSRNKSSSLAQTGLRSTVPKVAFRTGVDPDCFAWVPRHRHMLVYSSTNAANSYAGVFVWNGGKRARRVMAPGRKAYDDENEYQITGLAADGSKVYFTYVNEPSSDSYQRTYISKYVFNTISLKVSMVSPRSLLKRK